MADKKFANPAVFSKAAALRDKGLPVIELFAQMFADGQAFEEVGTFAIPVPRQFIRVALDP